MSVEIGRFLDDLTGRAIGVACDLVQAIQRGDGEAFAQAWAELSEVDAETGNSAAVVRALAVLAAQVASALDEDLVDEVTDAPVAPGASVDAARVSLEASVLDHLFYDR